MFATNVLINPNIYFVIFWSETKALIYGIENDSKIADAYTSYCLDTVSEIAGQDMPSEDFSKSMSIGQIGTKSDVDYETPYHSYHIGSYE